MDNPNILAGDTLIFMDNRYYIIPLGYLYNVERPLFWIGVDIIGSWYSINRNDHHFIEEKK